MNIVAIIQARMNSTRLHGKILKKLSGQTVLKHVLERCKAIENVNTVCCAIPKSADSDPVAEEALQCDVEVFRGSETDVLARYYQAAQKLKADYILRVTSDCPLIDPQVCAAVIDHGLKENADYCANNIPPTWPHGLDCEFFKLEWLQKAFRQAKSPHEREHVTPFIRTNPHAKISNLAHPNDNLAHLRWTLDTPQDFELINEIFNRLPAPSKEQYSYLQILKILEQEPDLKKINEFQIDKTRLS
ncbi:spore coat protein [Terasakiella brassicae]|uniref:Spore coat protein n=1 Tax=Terasakiella brassicae TaxID=1634917 RepID=A0A917BRR7_9PROT|nr:glycosyltransferase family protein [Terasakiella brassicae]GGF56318.1 spore coat protein [Terasakiella brassicae]